MNQLNPFLNSPKLQIVAIVGMALSLMHCRRAPNPQDARDKRILELEAEVRRLTGQTSSAVDKRTFMGTWRSLGISCILNISDNGRNLLVYDACQKDTCTANIDSNGDLVTSHGVKLSLVTATNHLLYLGSKYERISDQPNAADTELKWDEKREFNGGELYYTSQVTEDEATKLGQYLVKEKFFDGARKTVQLNKNGRTYEFRVVMKEDGDKGSKVVEMFTAVSNELSENVFNGGKVVVHLCDDRLKTLRVIPER